MRPQQLLPLCGLLLASVAIASKFDHDDVPNRCWPACSSVVGIAKSCDSKHERDSAEIQCICGWDAAKTQIPLCSACITQYQADRRNHNITQDDHDDDDDGDDDDNEALDLVHSCSLTTTTYNSTAATTVISTSTTTDTSNTATGTDPSSTGGTNSQDSPSPVSSGSSDSAGASPGSAFSSTPTPGAAAGISASGAAFMAGITGLMAFAWL
ncbi:hypothetical protein PITC_050160 [Penicillium italicum]|uniref:GPI anchored protein n=1 Tax=Penicillium italicum TaxID=40296 RepID=A0A0A2LAK2_PENIT|nr:hypothetical protein PITC_050160 [Penicillium italicum]